MTKTITIFMKNQAGDLVTPPLNYVLGLSLSNDALPTLYQESNKFVVEGEGTYYVFFKKAGFVQHINNVLVFLVKNDGPPIVLYPPSNPSEIRLQLLRSRITVERDGQNIFNVPRQSIIGRTTLLVNAESYYENISFRLNADRSQIIWFDAFKIEKTDVVVVDYFTTL